MVDFWIFNVKDDQNEKYRKKGIEIYNHRMLDGFWGLREYTSDGRKAANVSSFKENDGIVFYLIGELGKRFLETAALASAFVTLGKDEIDGLSHEQYIDWNRGVFLKNKTRWN